MKRQRSRPPATARDHSRLRRLAWFRYQLRRFVRFSERAARAADVTPQQHQLMLGVAGYTGRGWATISELAEFLQEQHHAVVGLVERTVRRGLVRKEHSRHDRRFVRVRLTRRGAAILKRLTERHLTELGGSRTELFSAFKIRPKIIRAAPGA